MRRVKLFDTVRCDPTESRVPLETFGVALSVSPQRLKLLFSHSVQGHPESPSRSLPFVGDGGEITGVSEAGTPDLWSRKRSLRGS